jgi:hypothetical protein
MKIRDGHMFSRDLSAGLRAAIARHGKDGQRGPAGPAGRDANGWVHLTGYLTCLGNCDDRVFTLPSGFTAGSAKAVFPLIVEDATFPASGSYYESEALVLEGAALSVGGGDTSSLNTLNVWVSGITFKAA